MKEIPLRGKYADRVELVDDEDYEALIVHKWYGKKARGALFYTHAVIDGVDVFMHRKVMGAGPGDLEIDHENGDGLDNQKGNLRSVTHSQNLLNTRAKREEEARRKAAYPYWMAWAELQLEWAEAEREQNKRDKPYRKTEAKRRHEPSAGNSKHKMKSE